MAAISPPFVERGGDQKIAGQEFSTARGPVESRGTILELEMSNEAFPDTEAIFMRLLIRRYMYACS